MAQANTDFGRVADDLRRVAQSFALLTSSASLFGKSLAAFREFEKQLVLTNAIAGGTVQQLEQMKQAARDFSLVTTTSAVEAGAALQQLAQAGFTAQQSMNAMNGVLLLAQATLSDIRVTSDVVSSNIRAFGLATTDATRVANVFSAAITGSLATMDKLAFAMRQVAPVAELAGLSIEETTAALGTLFNIGLRGEQAGTALRNIIIRLVRPLGEANDMLRDAGIATRTATGEFRNLADIMRDIGNSGLSDADLARIFETEALAGAKAYIKALQTINEEGVSQYDELRESITDTDRAVELAAANLATFDGAMGLFQNTIQDVAKDLGEAVTPTILDITDYIKGLVDSFRELDPATQSMITTFGAYALAAVGVLAVMSSLILLIKTSGIGVIAKWTGTLLAAAGGLSGLVVSIGSLLGALGTLVVGYNAATAAAAAFGVAGPIAIGAAAVAAAVWGISSALDAATLSSEEFSDALELDTDSFKIAKANAMEVADSILGEGLQTEIKARVDAINKELDVLRYASPLDRLGYAGRKEGQAKFVAGQASDALGALNEEFAIVEEYFRKERIVNEKIEEFLADDNGMIERFVASRVRKKFLGPLLDTMTDEQKAQLSVLREKALPIIDEYDNATGLVTKLQETELSAIQDLLIQLSTGDAELADEYAQAADIIKRSGVLNEKGSVTELAKLLAEPEGAADIKDILHEVLRKAGLPVEEIVPLLTIAQQEKNAALIQALNGLQGELSGSNEKVRIALLKQQLESTDNLAEATALAAEIGLDELTRNLGKLGGKLRTKFDQVLVDFNLDQREGVLASLQSSAAEISGIDLGSDAPGVSELLSGQWFIDGVNEAVSKTDNIDEAYAIVQEQAARYTKILEAYLDAMEEAGTVSPEQLASLRAAAAASSELIINTLLEGLGDADSGVESARRKAQSAIDKAAREREKDARKAERDRNKALREAKDAIRDARALEDAFRDVARASTAAKRTYVEAISGTGIDIRTNLLKDLRLNEIAADYEKQIISLRRQIEDVETSFTGTPEQLASLKSQYAEMITLIEQARDAEIASANSYTEQMSRRSKAIDLFIRDLQNVGGEAQRTFTKVGAGIAIAFAEYNKDLVTLIDITQDATTGFIDAISTGLADFIYDQENAWENFKKNMLNISRKIFEGFTEALLQQTISSLTGGAGSIIGNALQPSGFGSEGTPGVGQGGFLGKIFPNLFKTQEQNGASGAQLTEPLAQAVQQAAVSTQQVYDNGLQQTSATLSTFTTGLQQAFTNVVNAVNNMASTVGAQAGGPLQGVAGALSPTLGGVASATSSAISAGKKFGGSLADGIIATAKSIGADPLDLAAVISYETAGTFDALKRGPTTQYGQHRGLIQFGEPQAQQYGVDFSSIEAALSSQLGADGAIANYFKQSGFKPGMGLLDLYSTVNAGAPGRYNASDANNGGAPGSVYDKVTEQFTGHMRNAEELLGDYVNNDLPSGLQAAIPDPTKFASDAGLDRVTAQYTNAWQQQPVDQTTQLAQQAIGGGQDKGLAATTQKLEQVFNQFIQETTNTLNQFGEGFANALNQVVKSINGMAQQMQTGGEVSFSKISGSGEGSGGEGSGGGGIGAFISNLFSGFFADGGLLTGPGTGTSDSMLIAASNGEYIVNANATKQFLPLLEAINSNKKIPAFATGGLIGAESVLKSGFYNRSDSTSNVYNNNNRAGDSNNINVTYVINSNDDGRGFKRSANQHAKRLMNQIEKARKNT